MLALKVALNGVNFSVMFHSTNGNDFCSETGSSTASLLCGSTVGYPSDSFASLYNYHVFKFTITHCQKSHW